MRVLTLMGSGETSPTMVTVHRQLAERLGGSGDAVLLETPYGFQENAITVSERGRAYFADSVGLRVRVGTPADVGPAAWVFAGPGSPSYALRRWAETGGIDALRERVLARPGVTILASAAACTTGVRTLPVYEIYKAGADPHWLPGLDLLSPLGLPATVIPHYDNTEGGTHDTRYCYLGERRLSALERELPAGGAVLGVDEHTAVVLDLDADTAAVYGRGGVTVRRQGRSTVLPAGTTTPLDVLRAALRGERPTVLVPAPRSGDAAGKAAAPLLGELATASRARFDAAAAVRDTGGMTKAILDLEAAIDAWGADTEEDDEEANAARPLLRGLVGRLGELLDPAGVERQRDAVADGVLAIRDDLRRRGRFADADALRRTLSAAGIDVEDGEQGSRWRNRLAAAGPTQTRAASGNQDS